MKTGIFFRILMATLIPLMLVFTLIVSTINRIVYMHGSSYASNAAEMLTRQAAEQMSDEIAMLTRLMDTAARSLANMDYSRLDSRSMAEDYVRRLIAEGPAFYRVWLAFEPGVMDVRGGYYHHTLIQESPGHVFPAHGEDDIMADPKKAPCYSNPVSTGRSYLQTGHFQGPVDHEGPAAAIAMSFPILRNGQPIGGLGLDVLYSGLLDSENMKLTEGQTTFLVGLDGRILFSDDNGYKGQNFFDYKFTDSQKLAYAIKTGQKLMEEMETPFSKGRSLVALTPVRLKNGEVLCQLFISVPVAGLYDSTQDSMHLIVSTSVLGVLLLIFSVFMATRAIVRPLKQLSANFERVAGGDLDLDLAARAPLTRAEDPDTYSDEALEPDEEDEDSGWALECEDNEGTEDGEDDFYVEKEKPEHQEKEREKEREDHSSVVEIDILQSALRRMLAQIDQVTKERLEKEKVMAASQAQLNFFASMSHEIRTPMNAILGISEILLHGDDLKEGQRKYIRDIKISSESLLVIINDILDLSKLTSGKMALVPIDFRLLSFLDNLASMVAYLAADKHLDFDTEFADDLPHCLFGDDMRLRQVLLNLLSNAIKFTATGAVRFKVFTEGDTLRFVVTDTGVGIRAEDQPALFEPFKQMDTTRNRAVEGTGLGLSISRSLVKLMGGRIELNSEYGRGSTFSVTLPIVLGDEKKCRKQGMEQEIASQHYSSDLKVLVVDDNAVNRSVASGLLKTIHGISADLAASGPDALQKVTGREYKLVFMDHMMPEMDGVECTQRIRALGGPCATVPIIALTANAMLGVSEMFIAAGMNDFLAKPIVRTELSEILYKWIPAEYRLAAGTVSVPSKAKAAPDDGMPEAEREIFIGKLKNVGHINMAKALEALGGQVDIYYELLDLLRKKIPDMIKLVERLLAEGNVHEFSIHLHGLKSSLGSAGAMKLSAQARELEAASNGGDLESCQKKFSAFASELADLGRQLDAVYT